MVAKRNEALTPFFVADRPASLNILAGLKIPDGQKIGIMANANASPQFREKMANFPCHTPESCPAIGGKPCPYKGDITRCSQGTKIRESLITISDSGVFTKDGAAFKDYHQLFEVYEKMGVQHGIILDVLGDKKATLETAAEAKRVYDAGSWTFNLVGVAQGETVAEYVECYQALKKMDFEHVAVGGMLRRLENASRFAFVRDDQFLEKVLSEIRRIDPNGWIFALGCYSMKRHNLLREKSVFGADYKGWIFRYRTRSAGRHDSKARASRYAEVRTHIEENVLSRSQQWGEPRLLIVGCTNNKIPSKTPLQAGKLYDGPSFRVIRNAYGQISKPTEILVLSAKHGLIPLHRRISNYDLRMTRPRGQKMRSKIVKQLAGFLSDASYDSITISAGKEYREVLRDCLNDIGCDLPVTTHDGKIGEKLRDLKTFLLEPPS